MTNILHTPFTDDSLLVFRCSFFPMVHSIVPKHCSYYCLASKSQFTLLKEHINTMWGQNCIIVAQGMLLSRQQKLANSNPSGRVGSRDRWLYLIKYPSEPEAKLPCSLELGTQTTRLLHFSSLNPDTTPMSATHWLSLTLDQRLDRNEAWLIMGIWPA